jgi:hypothetical protein
MPSVHAYVCMALHIWDQGYASIRGSVAPSTTITAGAQPATYLCILDTLVMASAAIFSSHGRNCQVQFSQTDWLGDEIVKATFCGM